MKCTTFYLTAIFCRKWKTITYIANFHFYVLIYCYSKSSPVRHFNKNICEKRHCRKVSPPINQLERAHISKEYTQRVPRSDVSRLGTLPFPTGVSIFTPVHYILKLNVFYYSNSYIYLFKTIHFDIPAIVFITAKMHYYSFTIVSRNWLNLSFYSHS